MLHQLARITLIASLSHLLAMQSAMASDSLAKAIKLYDSAHYQEATPLLQESVRLNPTDARLRYYLANACAQSGIYSEAVKQYNECIKCDPTSEAARYSRLALLNYVGDHLADEKPPDPSQPSKPDRTNPHIKNYNPSQSIYLRRPVPLGLSATQEKLILDDKPKKHR